MNATGVGVSITPSKSTGNTAVAGKTKLGGPYGAAKNAPSQAPEGFKPATTSFEAVKVEAPKASNQQSEGAGGVFGGQGFKEIMSNKFMSKFVASGSTGMFRVLLHFLCTWLRFFEVQFRKD